MMMMMMMMMIMKVSYMNLGEDEDIGRPKKYS